MAKQSKNASAIISEPFIAISKKVEAQCPQLNQKSIPNSAFIQSTLDF
jgi:hypothetical protein